MKSEILNLKQNRILSHIDQPALKNAGYIDVEAQKEIIKYLSYIIIIVIVCSFVYYIGWNFSGALISSCVDSINKIINNSILGLFKNGTGIDTIETITFEDKASGYFVQLNRYGDTFQVLLKSPGSDTFKQISQVLQDLAANNPAVGADVASALVDLQPLIDTFNNVVL